jgi:adenine deaminase
VDLRGAYVAPGLIDAHVHIESSLCTPPQFASAVVPRGVTTVLADPHEIANVAGAYGVRFMADAARGLPLRVILMAPSCVPATDLATSGASLDAQTLEQLARAGIVHGLAEVMNYPGVIAREAGVAAKLKAFAGRPVDGHAPGVSGRALNAYIASGIGSDHECFTAEEAREKLARGMYVLIRDAMLFTHRRLILVDKQGMTGSKVEYHSLPYRAITHFSIETAGHFDLDADLKIWVSGRELPFTQQFRKGLSIYAVQAVLAGYVCK